MLVPLDGEHSLVSNWWSKCCWNSKVAYRLQQWIRWFARIIGSGVVSHQGPLRFCKRQIVILKSCHPLCNSDWTTVQTLESTYYLGRFTFSKVTKLFNTLVRAVSGWQTSHLTQRISLNLRKQSEWRQSCFDGCNYEITAGKKALRVVAFGWSISGGKSQICETQFQGDQCYLVEQQGAASKESSFVTGMAWE